MKDMRANIHGIYSEADTGKAKPLSETDESIAADEKPSQALRSIQSAFSRPNPTSYPRGFLRAREKKIEDPQRVRPKHREGSTVSDVSSRNSHVTTIDLTGDHDVVSRNTHIVSSFIGSVCHSSGSGSKSRRDSFISSAEQRPIKKVSNEIGFSRAHGGRLSSSAMGESYGQPINLDDHSMLSAKSRNLRGVLSLKDNISATEDDARREARAEREMQKEYAMMQKNSAMKREARKQNELEAQNKRLKFSLTSTDALPRTKTAVQGGESDKAEDGLASPSSVRVSQGPQPLNMGGGLQDTSGEHVALAFSVDSTSLSVPNSETTHARLAPSSGIDTAEYSSIPSSVNLFGAMSSRELQARSAGVDKSNDPKESSQNWYKRLLSPEESRSFTKTHHDGPGNPTSLPFLRASSPSGGQPNLSKPNDDEALNENWLFFPDVPSGAYTEFPDSVKGNGQHDTAVTAQLGARTPIPELETGQSASVHSAETEILFGDGSRDGIPGIREDSCIPLIHPRAVNGREPSKNDVSGTEKPGLIGGKQSAAGFSNEFKKAPDLLHVQDEKVHGQKDPPSQENKGRNTGLHISVEDLHELDSGTLYAMAPGNTATPTHEASPTLGTGQSQSPPAKSRRPRMTTPERKEARRRSAQKCAAKKRLERMLQNGQRSSSSSNRSHRPSSEIPYGSGGGSSRGEK